jgi:hypothetical protein
VLEHARSAGQTTLPARVSTVVSDDNANSLRTLRREALIAQARTIDRHFAVPEV